jgi:hypothetical protein
VTLEGTTLSPGDTHDNASLSAYPVWEGRSITEVVLEGA